MIIFSFRNLAGSHIIWYIYIYIILLCNVSNILWFIKLLICFLNKTIKSFPDPTDYTGICWIYDFILSFSLHFSPLRSSLSQYIIPVFHHLVRPKIYSSFWHPFFLTSHIRTPPAPLLFPSIEGVYPNGTSQSSHSHLIRQIF